MTSHHCEPWFIRLPQRYNRELCAIDESGLPFRLLTTDTRRGWEGQIELNGQLHLLRIFYPDEFPEAPPLVFDCADFHLEPFDDRGTFHQLANSALCLFAMGYGADSWSPEYTVMDVLSRYRAFRAMATAGTHVPDRYSEDEPVAAFRQGAPLYMSPGVAQVLSLPGGKGGFVFRLTASGGLGLVVAVDDEASKFTYEDPPDAWSAAPFLPPVKGSWCHIELEHNTWSEACSDPERLPNQVRQKLGLATLPWPPPFPLMLVRSRPESFGPAEGMLVAPFPEAPNWILRPVECVSLTDALFRRVDGVLTGRELLQSCTVILIGAGSLGSHAALALARAGVSRFALFDPDRLRLENVCRHVGDLAELGELKVDIVKRAILRRNPRAEVESHGASPLWDASVGSVQAGRAFEALLERPRTLVLVTAADDRVERRLNRILVGRGVPALYASVLGRGEHGRVFRVMPDKTACYQCILYAQATDPEYFPRLEAPEGRGTPGLGDYHQPGIPGIGIDVEQVALLTARFTLQTLGRIVEGGIGYPDERGDHLLWSNAGGWCFDRPLQLRIERYPLVSDCAVCGSGKEERPLDEAEREALRERSRRLQDPARLGGMLVGSPLDHPRTSGQE